MKSWLTSVALSLVFWEQQGKFHSPTSLRLADQGRVQAPKRSDTSFRSQELVECPFPPLLADMPLLATSGVSSGFRQTLHQSR